MKTFNVYKYPTQGFDAVKVGFSWPAFFFGLIWMTKEKVWGLAGLWIVAYAACSFIEGVIGAARHQSPQGGALALASSVLVAAYSTLWLVLSIKGNKWREVKLSKWGYELLNIGQAETPDAAVTQLAKIV